VLGKFNARTVGMACKAGSAYVVVSADALMDIIGCGLSMACQTVEFSAIGRIVMTVGTGIPDTIVIAGEDGEVEGIMIHKCPGLAGRVTYEAILTIINVTGDTLVILVRIGPVVFVTSEAREYLKVARFDMTG